MKNGKNGSKSLAEKISHLIERKLKLKPAEEKKKTMVMKEADASEIPLWVETVAIIAAENGSKRGVPTAWKFKAAAKYPSGKTETAIYSPDPGSAEGTDRDNVNGHMAAAMMLPGVSNYAESREPIPTEEGPGRMLFHFEESGDLRGGNPEYGEEDLWDPEDEGPEGAAPEGFRSWTMKGLEEKRKRRMSKMKMRESNGRNSMNDSLPTGPGGPPGGPPVKIMTRAVPVGDRSQNEWQIFAVGTWNNPNGKSPMGTVSRAYPPAETVSDPSDIAEHEAVALAVPGAGTDLQMVSRKEDPNGFTVIWQPSINVNENYVQGSKSLSPEDRAEIDRVYGGGGGSEETENWEEIEMAEKITRLAINKIKENKKMRNISRPAMASNQKQKQKKKAAISESLVQRLTDKVMKNLTESEKKERQKKGLLEKMTAMAMKKVVRKLRLEGIYLGHPPSHEPVSDYEEQYEETPQQIIASEIDRLGLSDEEVAMELGLTPDDFEAYLQGSPAAPQINLQKAMAAMNRLFSSSRELDRQADYINSGGGADWDYENENPSKMMEKKKRMCEDCGGKGCASCGKKKDDLAERIAKLAMKKLKLGEKRTPSKTSTPPSRAAGLNRSRTSSGRR